MMGRYPPSLLKIMAGEGLAENTGFHKIALQVVITSHALGKNEEQMLAACEGLLLNHVSDGHRYNTPTKRRIELQRLFRYTEGNPCYEYRKDAVRSLLPMGTVAPDLDGLGVGGAFGRQYFLEGRWCAPSVWRWTHLGPLRA